MDDLGGIDGWSPLISRPGQGPGYTNVLGSGGGLIPAGQPG